MRRRVTGDDDRQARTKMYVTEGGGARNPYTCRYTLLFKFDSGVCDFIHYIPYQVHNHDEDCEDYGGTHNQRVIAVGDAVYEVATYAGNGENLFDDERAGNVITGISAFLSACPKIIRLLDTPFALAVRI